ncbi:hypothetical protein AUP68_09075 [Ilyonectria robusta]
MGRTMRRLRNLASPCLVLPRLGCFLRGCCCAMLGWRGWIGGYLRIALVLDLRADSDVAARIECAGRVPFPFTVETLKTVDAVARHWAVEPLSGLSWTSGLPFRRRQAPVDCSNERHGVFGGGISHLPAESQPAKNTTHAEFGFMAGLECTLPSA